MQLGAFNPFYRNHNSINHKDQDPGSFSPRVVESMRKTVELRYSLIPHLYTLFYTVSQQGGTVARSLLHEFPRDRSARDIDEQFMWGSSLLISPCIHQGKTRIDVYLPLQARWFDFYTGKEVNPAVTTSLDVPRDFIPLHVRGGYIIPMQYPGLNTDESRKNAFELLVAPDEKARASGNLYWDDGESLNSVEAKAYNFYEFNYNYNSNTAKSTIEIKMLNSGFTMGVNNKLRKIKVFDVVKAPAKFKVDLIDTFVDYSYDISTRTLTLNDLNMDLMNDHIISVEF